jgi:hypothetical protein
VREPVPGSRPASSLQGELGLERAAALKRSGRIELAPVTLKHRKRTVIGPQAQHPLAGMVDHASGLEHQLLHHRANSSSLRCVTHRRIGLMQRVLAHQAQQVHRHRRQCAHQIVRVELARGQPGEIHVGLELRVKLLMRAVSVHPPPTPPDYVADKLSPCPGEPPLHP